MSHPSVVTLGAKRAPRRLVCGEELREVDLPAGTRVVYPRPPVPGSSSPERDIRQALDQPLGSEPLSARLHADMHLTIALETLYHGPDATYDYLGRALGVLVALAQDKGVRRIDLVLATGIHRRLFPAERKALLKHVDAAAIGVHVHDPEGEGTMLAVFRGTDGLRPALAVNRLAAQSDLLVTVALTGVPCGGGHAALVLGLGGHGNARAVAELRDAPDKRAAMTLLGATIEQHVSVFALELVLDSNLLHHEFRTLNSNEDDLSTFEQLGLRGINHLPRRARIELIEQAH